MFDDIPVTIPTKPKMIELNPDGYSIKGCTFIYASKGQAGEYSPLSTNSYRGCGHKCVYCYVPKVLRISREDFDNNVKARPNFIKLLKKDAIKYQLAGITSQVMLSFTTDPFNHLDAVLGLTRQTIQVLKDHGLGFCTLTKGGSRALRDLDLFRPNRDAFASTLTTLTNKVSMQWEPGAALPQDRLDTLKAFYDAGIFTWVSLEPVIDTETTLEIIRQSCDFVNLYKVGRINYHKLTKEIDWKKFTYQVIDLLNSLDVSYYIKKDLQVHLPSDQYYSPNKVPQYHV